MAMSLSALSLALAMLILCGAFGISDLIFVAVRLPTCRLSGLSCNKRLGGATGGTLSACTQIVEFVVLLASVWYTVVGVAPSA